MQYSNQLLLNAADLVNLIYARIVTFLEKRTLAHHGCTTIMLEKSSPLWINSNMLFLCVSLICLNFRAKMFRRASFRFRESVGVQPAKKTTTCAVCENGLSSQDSTMAGLSFNCPRSISQSSCAVRSDVSTDQSRGGWSQVNTCTNPDESTGESGYETIERPTGPNTSDDETVNEWTKCSSNGLSKKRSRLSAWILQILNSLNQFRQAFATGNPINKSSDSSQIPSTTHLDGHKCMHTEDKWPCEGVTALPEWDPCGIRTKQYNSGHSFNQHVNHKDHVPTVNARRGAFRIRQLRRKHDSTKVCDQTDFGRLSTTDQSTEVINESQKIADLTQHPLTRDLDSISLTSTSDIIDPIYSQVRNSLDELTQDEGYDNITLLTDEEIDRAVGCEFCWKRNSLQSQHISAHPSAHIYYELNKLKSEDRGRGSYTPRQRLDQESSCSAWSIRPTNQTAREGHFGRPSVQEPVREQTRSVTPPELPARLYGQSTVNLVNRLRHVLQMRWSVNRLLIAASRSSVKHKQKAATLSGLSGSPQSDCGLLPPHSFRNLGEVFQASCPTRLTLSNGFRLLRIGRKTAGSKSKCLIHCSSSINLTGTQLEQSKPLSEQSERDQFFEDIRRAPHHPELSVNERLAVQKSSPVVSNVGPMWTPSLRHNRSDSLGSSTWAIDVVSTTHLESTVAPGQESHIRHIDSEIDISEATVTCHCQTSDFNPGPLRHIFLPRQKHLQQQSKEMLDTTQAAMNNIALKSSYRRTRLPLQNKLTGGEQSLTMSPLMERSIEDEETRQLIGLH
ncbi:hypothetical protein EG68_00117 [Paragonimus skrjabini miyazakii]|uniref:Uncharacterized protein n=1 Tax=Paragonimus skrjabini miyazakii TaxID=59628 RepID=A0A8S9ZA25_9TREM|nr:hypothetical protein EG68_00117 [Paragonimus skrjabini miyazakii]